MTSSPTLLIVLTSHDTIGALGRATGFYFEEMATPYWAAIDAGYAVEIASIQGGNPPCDPSSLKEPGQRPASVERFVNDPGAMAKLENTRAVDALSAQDYLGIFLPGGHGTVWDFPTCTALAGLVSELFNQDKVIGAVCHGPTGLVGATRPDGRSILAGRAVNSFTDDEERAVGLAHEVPFLLESRIRKLGGLFQAADTFQPHAVRDANLITGQNPASSTRVAELLVQALDETKQRFAA